MTKFACDEIGIILKIKKNCILEYFLTLMDSVYTFECNI